MIELLVFLLAGACLVKAYLISQEPPPRYFVARRPKTDWEKRMDREHAARKERGY